MRARLNPGLNVLAGENDSGKTAVADAIRHLLWTTSQDYYRLVDDDFHVEGAVRATELQISAEFRGLTVPEQGAFLEWLTVEPGVDPFLCVTLSAQRVPSNTPGVRNRFSITFRSGKDGNGPPIEGTVREFLRITYLRPLRDAEAELTGGRNSRLSQILASHSSFGEQTLSDFRPEGPMPETLVGIMAQADYLIETNPAIARVRGDINAQYFADLSLGDQALTAAIAVSRRTELRQVLEKLDLTLDPPTGVEVPTRRGLGLNNLLFMATELLLLLIFPKHMTTFSESTCLIVGMGIGGHGRGAESIERSVEEAVASGTDAAGGQELRRDCRRGRGSAPDRVHVEGVAG